MRKTIKSFFAIILALMLLTSGFLYSTSAAGEVPADNPFASEAETFTNDDFAFPDAPDRWTISTYKTSSLAIHDTEIYYENGTYYAYLTNDTNVYSSTDMLNWTITGSKPRGWYSSSESMYVTWAPQLIKLRKPYMLDGEEYYYALWDSLSELGSQHSRIRCFVSKSPSPTQANGAGFRYIGDVMCSGKYALSDPSNIIESYEGTYNGKNPQYYLVDGYTTSYSATNANGWNAIDSMVLYDEDGKMWMSWGSWSGGIFICEIDEDTLMPKSDKAADYTRIAYRSSNGIEGPTIIYHDGYYYLNVAYGSLSNSYNTRIGRCENINGPYVDYNGNLMTNSNTYTGTKIAAPYRFGTDSGWLAQAHAAWVYNSDTDQYFMTSNGRPVGNTGSARMMVRPVMWTESGWPVVSPEFVTGDVTKTVYENNVPTGSPKVSAYQTIPTDKISGTYETVFFTRGTDSTSATASANIVLHEDYTVTGAYTGYWAQTGETQLKLQLNGINYEAAMTASYDWENGKSGVVCFSAISEAGTYTNNTYGAVMWGKQLYVSSPQEMVEAAISATTVPTEARQNITLPTSYNSVEISWASDNESVLSSAGVVNRLSADTTVTLTATFSFNGYVKTKDYAVLVPLREAIPSLGAEPIVYMPFDGDLSLQTSNNSSVRSASGTYTYAAGKYGQAVTISYVSGSSGLNSAIRLNNGAMNNPSEFTVSMWVRPTTLTAHVSTFFSRGRSKWTSIVPRLYGDNTAGSRLCDDTSGSSVWYDASSGVVLSTNQWYMLTYTYKDGTISYYLDGELKATVTGAVNPIDNGASQTFYIGANEWDGTFRGAMDDFYMFDKALNADQIGLLMSKASFEVYHKYGSDDPVLDQEQSISALLSGSSISAHAVKKDGYVFSSLTVEGITYEASDQFDAKNPDFSDLMRTNNVKVTYNYLPSKIVDMQFEGNTLNSDGASLLHTSGSYNRGTLTYEKGVRGQAVRMPKISGNALTNIIRLQDGLMGETKEFTLSMWVKADALTRHTAAFFSRAGSSGVNNKWMSVVPRLFDTDTAGVRICDDYQAAWYDTNGSVELKTGQWYMLTYTFNQGTTSFYVDGVKVGGIEDGASNPMSGVASQTFYIGGNQWDGSFDGLVDSFQMYREALSGPQIESLYVEQGPALADVISGIESGEYPVTVERDSDGYAKQVKLPAVNGYTISISASDNTDIIGLNGAIAPATADTTVGLTLKVEDSGGEIGYAQISLLIERKTNKSALAGKIAETEELLLNIDDYTDDTAEALKQAYQSAVAVNGDGNAAQTEIDRACAELAAAIQALVIYEGDEYIVQAGGIVSISVIVHNGQNVAAASATITYDKSKLTLLGVYAADEFMVPYSTEGNQIKINAISKNGLGKDGEVVFATLKFLANSGVEAIADTKVQVSSTVYAGNTVGNPEILPKKIANARVIIYAGIKGDVNFDGKVDLADALMVLQYVTGNREFDKQQLLVADMDGDGNITLADVMTIMNLAMN